MPKSTEDIKKEEKNPKKSTKTKTSTKTSKTVKTNKSETNKTTTKSKTSSKKATASTKSKTKSKTNNNGTSISKNKTSSKSSSKKNKSIKSGNIKNTNAFLPEYYDLPYRYNQTVVKILAQTPKMLFIYWDISDEDRKSFELKYGDNFFSETKPVLLVHNLDMNYTFEVEINDFANSWYLKINDADSKYTIELGRRPIYKNNNYNTNYFYISSSNIIETPNDHILIEKLKSPIMFKNVKSGYIYNKDIGSLSLISINNLYKKMYKDDILNEFNKCIIKNPSSSSFFK